MKVQTHQETKERMGPSRKITCCIRKRWRSSRESRLLSRNTRWTMKATNLTEDGICLETLTRRRCFCSCDSQSTLNQETISSRWRTKSQKESPWAACSSTSGTQTELTMKAIRGPNNSETESSRTSTSQGHWRILELDLQFRHLIFLSNQFNHRWQRQPTTTWIRTWLMFSSMPRLVRPKTRKQLLREAIFRRKFNPQTRTQAKEIISRCQIC